MIRRRGKKLDLDPLLSQNSVAIEAQNRADEGPVCSQWRHGGFKMETWSWSVDQLWQICMTFMRSNKVKKSDPH
jgi:hypothetical protein